MCVEWLKLKDVPARKGKSNLKAKWIHFFLFLSLLLIQKMYSSFVDNKVAQNHWQTPGRYRVTRNNHVARTL